MEAGSTQERCKVIRIRVLRRGDEAAMGVDARLNYGVGGAWSDMKL
jgi:hypothetical protein